jgi:uncharacterized protein (DUF305 family)
MTIERIARPSPRRLAILLIATAVFAAGAQAPDSALPAPAAADVRFITDMIHHHAQAVLIAGWASSHGASPEMVTLCARVVAGQQDEIHLMQSWLRRRGLSVPEETAMHDTMAGMPAPSMPGMLTREQLAQLDAARGADFDRLFLTFMIRHHQGAITMVNDLFASGGGEENSVYKLATGIYADQTTEIARMQQMLAPLVSDPSGP